MSHSFSYVNAKKQKQNRWLNLVIDFIKLDFQKNYTLYLTMFTYNSKLS